MSFAKEAWPLVAPPIAAAATFFLAGFWAWGLAFATLGLALLLFFRNPGRRFEGPADSVLAPADGRVLGVERVEESAVGPGLFHRVSTFLSVFDVHVQRAPAAGLVVASSLARGRKVAAYRPDAGTVNEQHLTVLRLASGEPVGVRQIAGAVARRVVCYLDEGDEVERGQVMGLIKFGSRVDLLVPESFGVLVRRGDRVRAGKTPVARAGGRGAEPGP